MVERPFVDRKFSSTVRPLEQHKSTGSEEIYPKVLDQLV